MSWNGASSEIYDPIWKLYFGDHLSDYFYSSRLFSILLRKPDGQNSTQWSSISCKGASLTRAQIPQYRRWFVVLRVPQNVNLEGTMVFVGPRWTNCGHFGSSFLALANDSQKRPCRRASLVLYVFFATNFIVCSLIFWHLPHLCAVFRELPNRQPQLHFYSHFSGISKGTQRWRHKRTDDH